MKCTTWRAEMIKTGQMMPRRIVWALGVIFSSLFLILTKVLMYIESLMTRYATGRAETTKMGRDDKNGPNDAQTHRLGPRCDIFLVVFDTN